MRQRVAGSHKDIEGQDHRLPTQVQFWDLDHLPLRAGKLIASFRKLFYKICIPTCVFGIHSFYFIVSDATNDLLLFARSTSQLFNSNALPHTLAKSRNGTMNHQNVQDSLNFTQAFVSVVFLTLLKFKETHFCRASALGQRKTT